MKFKKGDMKPDGSGRTAGTRNRVSREVQAFAQSILEDPDYVAKLKARIFKGKAPKIEEMMWHYAYGKPVERTEITDSYKGPVEITLAFTEAVIRAAERAKARETERQLHEAK